MNNLDLEKIIRTNFLTCQRSLKIILDDKEINEKILQATRILLKTINFLLDTLKEKWHLNVVDL